MQAKIDAGKDSQAGAPPARAAFDTGSSMSMARRPSLLLRRRMTAVRAAATGVGDVPSALLRSAHSTASLRGTWRTGLRRPGGAATRSF